MQTVLLKLSVIVTTAGTQVRASIDEQTVEQYAAEMMDGAKFPPVDVFHDGNQFILADGFHRVMSCTRNGFKDIEANVHKGTKSDALKFALKANSTHGLKRSNADKRRSVELALAEWPSLSSRELAKVCAVSDTFAGDVRKSTCGLTAPEKVQGGDGKQYKVPAPRSKTITPEKAKALMANVEPTTEQSSAVQPTLPSDDAANSPSVTQPNTARVAPSSLKAYKQRIEAIMLEAKDELSIEDLKHLRLHLDICQRMVRDWVVQKEAAPRPIMDMVEQQNKAA